MFVQRFLGSLRGKPCSSLETLQLAGKNVWRKVVLTFEKNVLARYYHFFTAVLSWRDKENLNTREV